MGSTGNPHPFVQTSESLGSPFGPTRDSWSWQSDETELMSTSDCKDLWIRLIMLSDLHENHMCLLMPVPQNLPTCKPQHPIPTVSCKTCIFLPPFFPHTIFSPLFESKGVRVTCPGPWASRRLFRRFFNGDGHGRPRHSTSTIKPSSKRRSKRRLASQSSVQLLGWPTVGPKRSKTVGKC